MNITLNAKINDLQSQLNKKMSKGELQISAIQEKLGKVEEDSTQLNATFIENDEELEVQIEELRESVAGSKADVSSIQLFRSGANGQDHESQLHKQTMSNFSPNYKRDDGN